MNTVSFLVQFVDSNGVQQQHHHDITVYEYIHAPGFVNRARGEIKSFVNRNYGHNAYGYTHYVPTFDCSIGRFTMAIKRNVAA